MTNFVRLDQRLIYLNYRAVHSDLLNDLACNIHVVLSEQQKNLLRNELLLVLR
jgi:hypothetical protein